MRRIKKMILVQLRLAIPGSSLLINRLPRPIVKTSQYKHTKPQRRRRKRTMAAVFTCDLSVLVIGGEFPTSLTLGLPTHAR